MKRLIKWQFKEYRSPIFLGFAVLFICAAVAAWLSYTLLHLPLDTVVTVFRLVQWFVFLVIIVVRYSPDIEISGSTRDAHTLALHVPLPRWWGLMAKLLGLLPLLLGYIAINAVMFHLMPDDLPQLAELSPQHALFRATGVILWGAIIMNVLIVRTRLTGVLFLPWKMRFLEQLPKLRSVLSSGLDFVAILALFLPHILLASVFWAELLDSGLPVPLQAIIVATVGLMLTVANGYLLEHYTPQLEPWV